MTNEEREIITGFIQRVGGNVPATAGSVPGTALAPVDREADSLIGDLFTRMPEARYRLTQTAFVQEQALVQATNRIKQLEYELAQTKQALQAARSAVAGARPGAASRGFFGGLFGGGAAQPQPAFQQPGYQQPGYPPPPYQAAPPPPQYAPGYQPGMFQRSGSGFLGSALTTAAGVAGGMVAGNALMDLFSGHHGMGGGFGGAAENVNVYPPSAAEASPWGGGAAGGSPWDNQSAAPDQSGWGDAGGGGGGWDNAGSNDAGSDGGWGGSDSGFDSGGGGFDNSGGGFDNG